MIYKIIISKDDIIEVEKKNINKIILINNIIKDLESKGFSKKTVSWKFLCECAEQDELSKLDNNIIKFIFQYALLYPKDKEEFPAPLYDFKHRNIRTLLCKDERAIFNLILNENVLSLKKQLDILIKIMRASELLYMKILYKKTGALIAMNVKDKTLLYISKLF